MDRPIPTYLINSNNNNSQVHFQFLNKNEFKLELVKAVPADHFNVSLWLTIRHILQTKVSEKDDFIVICGQDHQFTDNYSRDLFFSCIKNAIKFNTDIILGGVTHVNSLFLICQNLIWVEGYSGSLFTVIFKSFYNTILNYDSIYSKLPVDHRFSVLASKKIAIYPFISVPREIEDLGLIAMDKIKKDKAPEYPQSWIKYNLDLATLYKNNFEKNKINVTVDEAVIPVYIINLSKRIDRLNHVKSEFEGRAEFDISIIDACENVIGAVGLWESIRKVMELGVENDDDVLIFCEDDHAFTEHYSKEGLINNIIEAYQQGAELLVGGICGGFNNAIPITSSRLWVDHFWCTQFTIVFKSLFKSILEAPYDDATTADDLLSRLTSNKMIIHPFYSTQREFGYTDVTNLNSVPGTIETRFNNASIRLLTIQAAYEEYSLNLNNHG